MRLYAIPHLTKLGINVQDEVNHTVKVMLIHEIRVMKEALTKRDKVIFLIFILCSISVFLTLMQATLQKQVFVPTLGKQVLIKLEITRAQLETAAMEFFQQSCDQTRKCWLTVSIPVYTIDVLY